MPMPDKNSVPTIYGIPNCDSCRKARKWLDANEVSHHFHDLREDGVDTDMLERWAGFVGWKKLLNTRSTTWRSIAKSERQNLSEGTALALMEAHPTLIKRPVLDAGKTVQVGFDPESFATILA